MKIAIVKTCLWALFFLIIQTDNYKIADKLFEDKQYEASIKICTSELHLRNNKDTLFEKFLLLRASGYLELHQYDQSIKDYLSLIALKPNKTDYYTGLSYLYGETKQYQNCMNILNKALKIDNKDVYVLNNLSYYSSQIYNYAEAIRYANEGLKYVKDLHWKGALLNNRGYGYIGIKKYDYALNDINQSIALNPDNSFAYCYRAIVNIHLKRMETVCNDLEKAKNLGAISLTQELIKENCKN